MSDNQNHYCMCIETAPTTGKTKAALLNAYRWPAGSTITVKFLEGDSSLRERVKKVAREWTGPGMAHLVFNFVDTGDADVRVAFQQGDGSWSYLGTMCRQIPKAQATMNFGWLTPTSSEDELRRVVLHEFGHALGLIHEHQNPQHPIQWNKDAVRNDLSRPPNSWDDATIENNMFKRYDPSEVKATDVDGHSIMMYPIPKTWTLDGFSADLNRELSPTDQTFIRSAYPW